MSGARSTLRLGALVLALTVVASVALVPAAASVAALGGAAAGQVAGAPPLARLLARPPSDSFVYAADGSLLAVLHGDQVSLHRKLVEAVDAAELARRASKDQILADYLNEVYFGDGVYGIATAAEHYFSRPVGQLDLAQAAALAGTIAGPGLYRPTAGRSALLRRNRVLQRMATEYRDAWFTGFTPQLATSVWVGDPARQASMRNLFDGGPVYGGTFPALIFRQLMSASLAGQPVVDLLGAAGDPVSTGAAGPPGPAPTAGRAGTHGRRRHGHG